MEDVVMQFVGRRDEWIAELEDLFAHIGHRFCGREMQEHTLNYLFSFRSPIERKKGWHSASVQRQYSGTAGR